MYSAKRISLQFLTLWRTLGDGIQQFDCPRDPKACIMLSHTWKKKAVDLILDGTGKEIGIVFLDNAFTAVLSILWLI